MTLLHYLSFLKQHHIYNRKSKKMDLSVLQQFLPKMHLKNTHLKHNYTCLMKVDPDLELPCCNIMLVQNDASQVSSTQLT